MSTTNAHGYQSFELGGFNFRRDEYFAHITGRPATGGRCRTRWTSTTSCAR